MITNTQKIELISKCFGRYSLSGDEKNISIVCPYCTEKGKKTTKKKLSIDLESGIFHCWVCESKGRNVGRTALKFAPNKDFAKKLVNIYGGLKKEEVEEIKEEKPKLPEDFKLITNLQGKDILKYKYHIKYLKDRGITKEHCHKMCIGVSEDFQFLNRVIFPSFDINGELNYFIARSIDPNNTFRYKNCSVSRKDVIFNHFNLDFTKELFLVEGVFDMINTPSNTTCILGSWLDESYELFKVIATNKTPVVLCLDPDARSKAYKIMEKFNTYCIPAKISLHDKKDFGDMSREEISYHVENAKHLDFAMGVRYLIKNINSGSMF